MAAPPAVGAFPVVPSNDLTPAIPFWERLWFQRAKTADDDVVMAGWGCEVHLVQAGEGPWRAPEEHNRFGIFIRTPEVDAVAARVEDLVIHPGGVLRRREWGMYEFGLASPDGMLVRVGWPSHLIRERKP